MPIDEQGAVRVAIKSYAEISMPCGNFPLCNLQMQRAAIVVDVVAVRLIVNCEDLSAEPPEELRRQLVRSSVGAINDDGEIGQGKIMGNIVNQVVEISRSQSGSILLIVRIALLPIIGLGSGNDSSVTDVFLNEPFGRIVQLAS